MPIENDLHSSLILSPKVGLFIKDDLKTKLKGYSAKAMIIKGDCKLKLFFFKDKYYLFRQHRYS